jgi:hypothetical protein
LATAPVFYQTGAVDSSMPKFSVESKIRLGLAVGLAGLLGFGWLTGHSISKLMATEDWVAHTHEVLTELESTRAALTEEEAGVRGYLLAGSPDFLDDRQAAAQRLLTDLARLRNLTRDNPGPTTRTGPAGTADYPASARTRRPTHRFPATGFPNSDRRGAPAAEPSRIGGHPQADR